VKIGILTFHDTTNFGAVLQAVATYKAVESLGEACEIINYHCRKIDERELPHNDSTSIRSFLSGRIRMHKHNELMRFLTKEAVIGNVYYTRENIGNADGKYKKYIVGSDMCWCTKYTDSDYTYMLDFVKGDSPKAAFGTSVGFFWNERETSRIKELLDSFQIIAVRERDASLWISGILNKQVFNVCDPTMLIVPDIWKAYAKTVIHGKYSLVYMEDAQGRCMKMASDYSREEKVRLYVISTVSRLKKNFKVKAIHSVRDFLGIILHANILFTASYHGMLFAVYFHVPFVFFNKDSSRLISLAKILGVEHRNGDLYHISEMKPIDWEVVDERREQFAAYSKDILAEIVRD